jgi:hypothetical protein
MIGRQDPILPILKEKRENTQIFLDGPPFSRWNYGLFGLFKIIINSLRKTPKKELGA